MNISFLLSIGAGLACLFPATAIESVAEQPTRHFNASPVYSDWETLNELQAPPDSGWRWLDVEDVLVPPVQHSYPVEAPVQIESRNGGVRTSLQGLSGMGGGPKQQGTQLGRLPETASVHTLSYSQVSANETSKSETVPVWFEQLMQLSPSGAWTAATPWAAIGAAAFVIILLARWSSMRSESAVAKPVRALRKQPAATVSKAHAAIRKGEPTLESWITDSMSSGEIDPAADYVSRDKSEERRQLESWRKLSQKASKEFILREEEEAAKQHALWLSLVAVGLGVSGLGIIATSSLGAYSLLCGVSLAVMSVVMLSWGGLKVVFHQLRRWILLRPIRN